MYPLDGPIPSEAFPQETCPEPQPVQPALSASSDMDSLLRNTQSSGNMDRNINRQRNSATKQIDIQVPWGPSLGGTVGGLAGGKLWEDIWFREQHVHP
jgi:hypothetical protein